MRNVAFTVALFTAGVWAAGESHAQCEPVWSGLGAGANWEVRALAAFDEDGAGPLAPALFIGGGFGAFGGQPIPLVARWDGWSASAVGGGLVASDYGLASLLGVPQPVGAIPAGLYVGGEFDEAGGTPVNNLARWMHGEWSDVGGGVTRPPGIIPYVFAMQVFDEDGEGPGAPALFIGGQFEHAGGVVAHALARWDGQAWSEVGGGLREPGYPMIPATVNAMAVYDDGRGPALYVGGNFAMAGGKECWNIARWDGKEWESLGPGLGSTVDSLCDYDEDGAGPKRPSLFVGGKFNAPKGGSIGDLMRIGRWDGRSWSQVGGWATTGAVKTMATWDADGAGPQRASLFIGGFFKTLPDGTPCNRIARWDGEQWHTVGDGVSAISGIGPDVVCLAVFDEDGPGSNPGGLYVGGLFSHAGGVPAKNIARWGCPLPASKPCYADCDASGSLEFFDFLCFQDLFAALDPGADCDSDGEFTFFDFLCFQNAFAAGCP